MRTIQREIKEMLSVISTEMDVPYEMVEDIYFHEFKFVSEKMSNGKRGDYDSFDNILVKHLGTFIANKKYILKLKELDEKRNTDQTIIQ